MEIKLTENISNFLSQNYDKWIENEAENGALIKVSKLAKEGTVYFTVYDSTKGTMTACLVPEDQILFTRASKEAVEKLAQFIYQNNYTVPGIFAPNPSSFDFVKKYSEISNIEYKCVKQLGHYELDNLTDIQISEGKLEKAKPTDKEVLIKFRKLSILEENTQRPSNPEESINKEMNDGALYVWKDSRNKVVSMGSTFLNRSPRSAYISGIYTPQNLRNKGFATSLVFDLSKLILSKNLVPSLSVDIANKPAICVYKNVGFSQKCIMDNIRFNTGNKVF